MLIGSSRKIPVFAFAAPVDLRKGFDGLSALVREQMGKDPTSGALYLFVSRNRIRAKVLHWDGTGLCVYAKRLEAGRFAPLWERQQGGEVRLSTSELALFLEGAKEVGRRSISPPEVDPNRQILGDLYGRIGSCSRQKTGFQPGPLAASARPTKPLTAS